MTKERTWNKETRVLTVDKSEWPRGEWDDEPDREEFEHAGLRCIVSRGPSGAWCGYVGIEPAHPLYGRRLSGREYDERLDVHGGVTYSEENQDTGTIGAVDATGEPLPLFWVGFDCSHLGDLMPAFVRYSMMRDSGDSYCAIDYAKHETKKLAAQLASIAQAAA